MTKIHIVKTVVFTVVIYSCESWNEKAEHQRIDAFELWFKGWRKLLEVSWRARRSNQPVLREINLESLEGLMLKLKLQCFGYLMWTDDSLEKSLMLAEGEERVRGWDGWTASLTRWTWVWVNSGSWWWTGRPGVLRFMGSKSVGYDWATKLNWTDTFYLASIYMY